MSRSMRTGITVALALALVLGGAFLSFRRPPAGDGTPAPGAPSDTGLPAILRPGVAQAADIQLTPSAADRAGVDPQAHFVLTSARPLDLGQVRQGLSVTPAVDVQVQPAGSDGKRFQVVPGRSLEPDKVYRIRLAMATEPRPYQWSFQTRSQFRILGTLPRHQGTGVPVNTGIEVNFSHAGFGDPAAYFDISPRVAGRFERHNRTLVFVPTGLAPGTVYTVRIKAGLPLDGTAETLAKEHVFAFETQPLQSPKGEQAYFSIAETNGEFGTRDTPYFMVAYHEGKDFGAGIAADVTVYRYPGAREFTAALQAREKIPAWADAARNAHREDPGGLARAAAFQTELKSGEGYYGSFVLFPQPLDPGYYLADITVKGMTRQVRFQVTDLISYVAVTRTGTLVWLNDLTTGAPAAGARIQPEAGAAVQAGPDGVATLPTPPDLDAGDQRRGLYLVAATGTPGSRDYRETVVHAQPSGWYPADSYYGPDDRRALYWKYLYLDRALYKPDDTVRFWGVLQPREPEARPVPAVTARLLRSDWEYRDGRPQALATTQVAVAGGTYTGSLALPNVKPGYYNLEIQAGDLYIQSGWFQVQTYTKPAYRLDLTLPRRAVFADEEMSIQVDARFFEGTPVHKLALNYNAGVKGGSAVTDAAGVAQIPFAAERQGNMYSAWNTNWVNVRAAGPEAGEITASGHVMVFRSRVNLDARYQVQDNRADLRFKLNQIVLDRLNAAGAEPWSADFLGAPAGEVTVSGTITEDYYVREDAGEWYDFINKVTHKRYNYRYAPREVGTFAVTTGADGTATHTFAVDPERSYRVRVAWRDSRGTLAEREIYVWAGRAAPGYGDSINKYYHLQAAEQNRQAYRVGEEAATVLLENGAPVHDRRQGFLFYTARRGLQFHQVQDSATFRFRFRAQDVPNTNLRGVYFDGRSYRPTPERTVRFDEQERALQVSVRAEKAAYRPGETVNLAVQVTDRQGRPARAQVNLNLVDEALYALADQRVNLLGTLYGEHVASGVLRTRHSHLVPMPAGGAEKGGDGGGARKDFQDAIFFETVQTGADGRAAASFRVPDNLTSWRVTCQALSDQMGAGSGTILVPVKLPFFVDLVLNDAYLAGDRPVALVRTYGGQLAEGQAVGFTVTVTGPGGPVTRELAGRAFATVAVPLPELQAGAYTVQVAARAGSLADTLEKKIRAETSFMRKTTVTPALLAPGLRPAGGDQGQTTLTFTHYERGLYLAMLQQLRWSHGNRAEQRLARAMTRELLDRHFGLQDSEPAEFDGFAYQTQEGGIAILPYADNDLALSARMADLAPGRFDRAALGLYFQKVLDNPQQDREQVILALYGLAALDQPVLNSLAPLLAEPDLTLPEQLHLALAMAALGDHEGARAVLQAVLQGHGEVLGQGEYVRIGAGARDQTVELTALAAVLAAKVADEHTVPLARYLMENQGQDVLTLAEQLLVLQAALPRTPPGPVSFTYTLKGREERREIRAGESFRLILTPAELADLQVTAVSGKVGVTSTYTAPFRAADQKPMAGMALAREYSAEGRTGNQFESGDLVKVTLHYSFPATVPAGWYEVSDFVPAGLKLVTRPHTLGDKARDTRLGWPVEINGQKVTFFADSRSGQVVYFARVATPGTYTAENAVLQHGKTGEVWALTERATLQVR